MKRIKILLLLFFLATGFSVNAMNLESGRPSNNEGRKDNDHKDKDKDKDKGKDKGKDKDKDKGKGPHTRAPLDGGLLTVLGVAGVGYYAARKKGKKLES
jgi:hypothetical protein